MRYKSGIIFLLSLLCWTFQTYAAPGGVAYVQQQTTRGLKGVVYDSTGEPVVGASVVIYQDKKLITGTTTEIDGSFSITSTLRDDYEVRITYVGYKTISYKYGKIDASNLKVTLEEDRQVLDDVVVTGYFTKSKNSFTGSVAQIKGDDLKQVTGVNLINAIAALTPGMEMVQNTAQGSNPNHVPELVLRGMSSFSNQGQDVNQPTVILDGSEISMEALYDLDMNEIESINVLKDASATALYGSKAANGVIVIVRKPIEASTLRVSYNFTGNLQFPMLNSYDVLNATEKLEYERLAGLYDGGGAINAETGLPLQYTLDELYNERYKIIQSGVDTDWLAQPARTAFSHDNSLRVYGGVSNLRYELNSRFADTKGVMKDDFRHRYSLGFKLSYYLSNKVSINNRTSYQEIKNKATPYGSFSQYVRMNPYDRAYNEDGSINTELSWDMNNPLYEASLKSFDLNSSTSFSNQTELRLDISQLWRVSGRFNISSTSGYKDKFLSPKSLEYKNQPDPSKRGIYTKGVSRGTSYNGNIQGAFNKVFDDNSLISLNAGWEINSGNRRSEYYQAMGFYNENLSFVSQAAGYPPSGSPSGSQSKTADVGAFLNATASYQDRYFVDGTWRATGSSQFGENRRWGHFWSAGAGWNILNENFMKEIKSKFDILKIRYSMGYTGKVSFAPFQAMTMYRYSNQFEYRTGIGAIPITIGDVNLMWERTMNYNAGLDLSMFGRRLNLIVDAYVRNTEDLLLDRSLAPSTGVTSATQNLGEMQNRGIEFSVDGYIIRTNKFYWKLGATGYMNRNKLTKINEALRELNRLNAIRSLGSITPLPQYAEGESTTSLKLVRSAGIDPATGQEVYIKRDGTLTFNYDVNDKVVIGDIEPRFTSTVNTNVYWKGFSLYALFSIRTGAWIYNTTRVTFVEGADPMFNADQRVFDYRWKQPGDIAMYKDIADTSVPEQTDRFAEKENVLSLVALNFSYEFPKNFCKKIHLRSLRAGINFNDLFRLSTVKMERGRDYLYSNGCEFTLSTTL